MLDPMQAGRIDGRTRVLVHLSYPSDHVKTPQMFNARCAERQINAVLVPWQVQPGNLEQVVSALRHSESVPGMIVTMPHKESAALLCDELEGVARDLRVTNAIRKDASGRLIGTALDGVGFVNGLVRAGHDLKGRQVLMVGAGGVALMIAESLIAAGVAGITVANRTRERGEDLVRRVRGLHPHAAIEFGAANARGAQLVVNATALGMHEGDALPFDVETIEPGSIVAEVIMEPAPTELLKQAALRGAIPHPGRDMLVGQIDGFIDFVLGPVAA